MQANSSNQRNTVGTVLYYTVLYSKVQHSTGTWFVVLEYNHSIQGGIRASLPVEQKKRKNIDFFWSFMIDVNLRTLLVLANLNKILFVCDSLDWCSILIKNTVDISAFTKGIDSVRPMTFEVMARCFTPLRPFLFFFLYKKTSLRELYTIHHSIYFFQIQP